MNTFYNNMKTAVLLAVLFGLLVWVGSFWGAQGMIFAGIFAIMMNFGAWFFSDKIAVAAMRGKQVDAPVIVQPGQADDSITVALGYGRKRVGRVGEGAFLGQHQQRLPAFSVHGREDRQQVLLAAAYKAVKVDV